MPEARFRVDGDAARGSFLILRCGGSQKLLATVLGLTERTCPMASKFRRRRVRRYRPASLAHGGVIHRLPRPRVEIDRGLAWYCLWTAALAERRVETALRDAGLATYAPVETVRTVKRGRVVEDERLAVGRYVFVGLHGAQPQWDAVHEALERRCHWTIGIPAFGRVLKSRDGVALRVPASALQKLADGLSLADEGNHAARTRLAAGGACKAVSGVFAGFLGVVQSSDDYRVRALLDVFGRKTAVEFSPEQLEAA